MVHYSGTFGLAHEQHTITEAMRHLRDDSRFRFVFAGGGARRERLESFCRVEEIGTAEFRPYARRSELGGNLADGHVGLVTQMPETMGAVVPSKTYGIMAAGRPFCSWAPKARLLRASLHGMDVDGESSRGTWVSSDFLSDWSRIGVWCGKPVVAPAVRLRNTTTSQSDDEDSFDPWRFGNSCEPCLRRYHSVGRLTTFRAV